MSGAGSVESFEQKIAKKTKIITPFITAASGEDGESGAALVLP